MRRTLPLLASLLFLFAACQAWPPVADLDARETRFEHGTSFGMCLGYCTTTLLVDADTMVLTLEASGRGGTDLPDRRFTRPTPDGAWERLSAHADTSAFAALPEVLGCPDCADGGAEWIAVRLPGGTARVTYEYNDRVDAVATLQNELRTLRALFEAEVETARREAAGG